MFRIRPDISIVLAVGVLAASHPFAVSAQQAPGPTTCPDIVSQRADWIVRVECDAAGKPLYIEHKWPFGNPENIGLVHVPWGYRDLIFGRSVGAQLLNNGHKPSVEQGYAGFFIWALLPGLTMHDQRIPPVKDRAGEFELLTMQVSPIINKTHPTWDGRSWFLRGVPNRMGQLKMGPSYPPYGSGYRDIPLVRKEARFGLKRIGPERVVIDPTYEESPFKPGAPPYNDLWFDGDTPETSTVMIVCGSDYRRNGERDPDDNPRTLCEHEFAHDGLNAGVRMTYWKMHLSQWHDIQIRAASLLDSFKINLKPGK